MEDLPGVKVETPLIGVMGEFSRGKSALINALTGESTLLVHPLPTTNQLAELTYQSVRLLDTPGIGALDPHHAELTLSVVNELAALIFVFASDPPLSAAECDFLREVLPRVPCVLLVQTKIDLLDEQDRCDVLAYHRGVLDHQFPQLRDVPILPVSTLTGEGMAALREALDRLNAAELEQARRRLRIAELRVRLKVCAALLRTALDTRRDEVQHADSIRVALTHLQAVLKADDAEWRAELYDVVEHLPDYVLGNLSALIYKADPAELMGKRGVRLASDEICRVRDQVAHEAERVLHHLRLRIAEQVQRLGLAVDSLPRISPPIFPDLTYHTIPIQVNQRRLFTRLNAEQTLKAYRAAAGRMAEEYALRLTPALIAYLDQYLSSMTAALIDLHPDLPNLALQLHDERYVLLLEAIGVTKTASDSQ